MAFPHDGKKFTKGKSGNKNGKPKGVLSRKTIIEKWLSVETKDKNPLTNQASNLTQEDYIVLAMIKQARSGDVKATEFLFNGKYGKETAELSINQNFSLPITYWVTHSEVLAENQKLLEEFGLNDVQDS